MKKLYSRALRLARDYTYVLIAVAAVAVLVFVFTRGGGEERQTLVATLGDFVQQVSLSGKVVAAQQVDLGFAQGGRVSHVQARVGQRVSAGATLAEVENGDLRAAVLQRQAALETAQAKLAAIQSGTRPEQLAITRSSVASAHVVLEQADRTVIEEIHDAYTAAETAVRNTLDQFFTNPRTSPELTFITSDTTLELRTESGRRAAESMLVSWQSEILLLSPSDNVSGAVMRAQERLAAVVALLADANGALNRAVPTTNTPQSTLDSYISDVGSARSSVNAATAALTSAVTAQKNAQTALATAERRLELELAGAAAEDIAAQAAQVKAAEADLLSARAQLIKTIVSAPFEGIITAVDAKVGQPVGAGARAVSMINTGAYQVESFVPEINVSLLAVGDKATVTLDAYGESVPFEATVVSIDPAETVRDGVSTYRAVLQFTDTDERIRAGMTANVVITTEEKQNVIAIPQGALKQRGGAWYVRIVQGGGESEREVTVGSISSFGETEILSGLMPGDVVILK